MIVYYSVFQRSNFFCQKSIKKDKNITMDIYKYIDVCYIKVKGGSNMRKIKIGQIGIGHNHGASKMEAIRKRPDLFEVVGFSEDDTKVFEQRGEFNAYKGLRRMSREELISQCDAILVETGVPNLTETAMMCAEAGKHIHMDKPASGTLREYKKLLDTAKEKSLVLQLGYMYRYNPAIMRCMELIRDGKLGEIYSINAEMSTYHSKPYKEWLTGFKGGIMYILGSHLVDLVVSILGEPKKITSFLKHTGFEEVDFPDNNLAVLEYEKALARIFVSSVEVNGWGRRQLVVSGTLGTVSILPIENKTAMTYSDRDIVDNDYKDQKIEIPIDDVPQDCRYDSMVADFYEYIIGAKENPYTYEHEYKVQKVLCDICAADKRKNAKI